MIILMFLDNYEVDLSPNLQNKMLIPDERASTKMVRCAEYTSRMI